jgi:propionate CoA-transferase
MAGYVKVSTTSAAPQPLNERKIIARRAALELKHASTVNLGIGIPELIGNVAGEEDISDELILTIESGFIGGMPVGGMSFGSAVNYWAAFPMTTQFDFYNGGGLKMAFLGFAEIGPKGDVNSSKFGGQLAGCGGFIDISQFTPHMVFCGTLTAGGLEIAVEDGKLKIVKEGNRKKLLKEIEQITFSSEYARKHNQEVMVVTERCVFQLTQEGFMLSEVAEGIDIQTQVLDQMEFMPIVPANVKIMDPAIFREGLMGLKQRMERMGS